MLLSAMTVFGQDDDKKAPKKYQSLLWEITGNGIEKPSYLYGTMHVSRKVAFHLSDTFFIGIRNADVIALETDPGNWMAEFMESEMEEAISSLGRYRRSFYRTAFGIDFPTNKDLRSALSRDHNMLNGMLYRFSDRSGNFEEDTYLDLFIYQAGKKYGKKVHSLEDFKESMDMLDKAMKAQREEETSERGLSKLYREGKNPRELLEDSYRRGDLDMLDSVSKMMNPSKGYQHWMINKRNEVMANGMDSIMQNGEVVFTGVGAAHLPGEHGVIDLLRAKGYKVRAVNRKVTAKSTKMKKKIMAMIRDMEHFTGYSTDSAFKVSVPGTLFETPSDPVHREYFLPEMANGAFYAVDRVSTFGALQGMDEDYMLARIDSLLFENIPGEILSKKEIVKNGYKGLDITNQLKRGDIQRYNIIVTPLEVIIFRMGGTGDYLKRSRAQSQFFNSISLAPNVGGWNKVQPVHGTYLVEMPGNVVWHKAKKFGGDFLVHQAQSIDPATGDFYMTAQATYHDFDYLEDDTFELKYFGEQLADRIDYKLKEVKFLEDNTFPSAEMVLEHEEHGKMYMQVHIRGAYYYMLLSKGCDCRPDKFFDSFKFTDFIYAKEPELYKDTLLNFSVNSFVEPKKSSSSYYGLYGYGRKKKNKYASFTKSQLYSVDETLESVEVKFHRYSRYYESDSIGAVWKFRSQFLPDEEGNYVLKKDTFVKDGLPQMHAVMADSASTRRIEYRYIFKHGAMWTLKCNYDSIAGKSRFVNTFFESFAPADSLIGEDIFATHAAEFFEALGGEDSVARAYALENVRKVHFDDAHAPDLITLIDTFDYDTDEDVEDFKSTLVKEVVQLEHEAVEPFLTELYKDSYNDAEMQLIILKALCNKDEQSASDMVLRLIEDDTPLTSKTSKISSLFRTMDDSLELAATLFPDLIQLVEYPEYEKDVYKLLATLVDSSLIQPKLYEKHLMQILREGKYELKRQIASESDGDESVYDRKYGRIKVIYAYNDKLMNLATLLFPYRDKREVASFFDRMQTSTNKRIHMHTSLLALRNEEPVTDTLWRSYAADLPLRLDLYAQLKKLDTLSLFPAEFKTQKEITRAMLYGKNYKPGKDSLEYVGKYKASVKGEEGWVHFFKMKPHEKDYWKLGYVGLMPLDSMEINIKPAFEKSGLRFDDEEEMEEIIEEKLQLFRTVGRKRVEGSRGRSGGSLYDLLDY